MEPITLLSVVLNFSLMAIFVSVVFFCLKIKTTKKTPELQGTVGTVKTFSEDGPPSLTPGSPPSLNTTQQSLPSHNVTCKLTVVAPPSAPSPVNHGNNSSTGHSPAPSPYYPEHRTPSRAGERKLPEIPKDLDDNVSMSELYDTLGPPEVHREASDSETETDGARANHPYARVKKRNAREHPYATVSHHSRNSDDHVANEDHLPLAAGQPAAALLPENSPAAHFSGDSQDSSKGYTSISVREPLCHIQPPVTARNTVPLRQNATYMAVSETSDDMYAAIEDPTYIPTGGISQTNSDTYAVINLPDYDSGSQTYQKLEGAEEDEEDISSPAHTYSKIDKNKKKRASAPPPPLPPPHHPGPSSVRPLSFNVDDMYAKVQKSPPARSAEDILPVGASAMSNSERGLRARSAQLDPTRKSWEDNGIKVDERRIQRGEVNYSDFEVTHFDPSRVPSSEPVLSSPKFFPLRNRVSADGTSHSMIMDTDAGYETVPEAEARLESAPMRLPPTNDHNYERVVEYWLRRPPGSVNTGAEFPAQGPSTSRTRDHGYETVTQPQSLIGYPVPHRVTGEETDPPYAMLNTQEFDDESEEGYETIPANERKDSNDDDPGYERVRKKESMLSHGYEVVGSKHVVRRESSLSKKEPGYETVKNTEHDYEIVTSTKKISTEHGYETVNNFSTSHTDMRSLPHQVDRLSFPPPPSVTTAHPPAARSISLSPKLGATKLPPVPSSPSARMSVHAVSLPPVQHPRSSSVTIIELRSETSQHKTEEETVLSGTDNNQINSHIFV